MAHFVRGQWLRAAFVHPGVFLLAVVCLLFVPWSWASSWRGRSSVISDPLNVGLSAALAVCAVTFVHWTARLFGH